MLPYATHSTQFPPFPRLWKEKQIRAMPEAARDPEMLFSKGRWRSGMYRQSSGTRLGTRWIHKLSIRQLGVSGYTTLSKVATCCDAKSHCKGSNRTFHLGKGSHLGVPKIDLLISDSASVPVFWVVDNPHPKHEAKRLRLPNHAMLHESHVKKHRVRNVHTFQIGCKW